jgi:hypothetical protein
LLGYHTFEEGAWNSSSFITTLSLCFRHQLFILLISLQSTKALKYSRHKQSSPRQTRITILQPERPYSTLCDNQPTSAIHHDVPLVLVSPRV